MTDDEYVETRGMTVRAALLGSLLHKLTKDRRARADSDTERNGEGDER
jgi:hypothetical protein